MTNQQKDQKDAQDYILKNASKIEHLLSNPNVDDLEQVLVDYVIHLENIGRIKFTGNRYEEGSNYIFGCGQCSRNFKNRTDLEIHKQSHVK